MRLIFQLFGFDFEEYQRLWRSCFSVTIGLSLLGFVVTMFVYYLSGYADGRAVTPAFYGFIDQFFSGLAVAAMVILGWSLAYSFRNTIKVAFIATTIPVCMGLLYFTHREVKKQVGEGAFRHPLEEKRE